MSMVDTGPASRAMRTLQMMKVYGMSSPNVLKVTLLLSELEADYEFIFVNLAAGDQFGDEFRAMNPNCKVPVLVDPLGPDCAPYVVFESGAIMLYLAEKYWRFIPRDGRGRYDVVQWLILQMANIGPMFGQLTHFLQFAPGSHPYSLSRYHTASGNLYDMLNRRLADHAFLAGEDYSIADMAAFPWVMLYHERHQMKPEDHPHLMRWQDNIAHRPAVTKAMVEFARRKAIDPSIRPDQPQDGLDRFFGWGRYARS